MNASSEPTLPLWGVALLLALCASSVALAALAASRSRWLRERITRYVESLDGPLRAMLLAPRGESIFALQVAATCMLLGGVLLGGPLLLVLIALLVALAPAALLGYLERRRRQKIEAMLDGFALALANATRATASVGRALGLLLPSLAAPLDAEIRLTLREMRLGSSLSQALLRCSARVQSPTLDALLSNILIALRVGGDLPHVLETTAATLREMARLASLLRAKTAPARIQLWVLCGLPPIIVMAFDAVSPGYFAPLGHSALGRLLFVVALGLWLAAVLLARRILAVQL